MSQLSAEARHTWLLALILLIGMALRVGYAMQEPTLVQFTGANGGDSAGYLANGAGFFSGKEHGWIRDFPFYNSNLKPAPLYIIFVGGFQVFLPDHEAIIAIRLVQSLASIVTAYLAYRMAAIIARRASAGILAAALMALHPALITEPANIATETLYIFFLAAGLWLYLEFAAGQANGPRSPWLQPVGALALSAAMFGLATLTRGVSALFPLVLALHILWLGRHQVLRNWRRHSLLLLVAYAAMVSTWTIHNLLNWNRIVIVSDQLMAALWRGAESSDGSPAHNDKLLLEGLDGSASADCDVDCVSPHSTENYINKIEAIVSENPAGYLALRINELAYAILQPYGTTPFGAVSVMQASQNWLVNDRSLDDLLQVLRIEGFAIKLATWVFHYIGIGFSLLGMLWTRKRWITAAPLAGFALYTIAAHFFLLALPRYLFPIEIVWLIFAGIALAELPERWRMRRSAGRGG